jgi:hypothetical protein
MEALTVTPRATRTNRQTALEQARAELKVFDADTRRISAELIDQQRKQEALHADLQGRGGLPTLRKLREEDDRQELLQSLQARYDGRDEARLALPALQVVKAEAARLRNEAIRAAIRMKKAQAEAAAELAEFERLRQEAQQALGSSALRAFHDPAHLVRPCFSIADLERELTS